MIPCLSAIQPLLAQTATTDTLDSLVGTMPQYTALQLAVFVLTFAVVVILFVLGTEFWTNLYGVLTAPSVAFSRIMGEQQLLPALFVVLMTGIIIAIFALMITQTQQFHTIIGDKWAVFFQSVSDWYGGLGIPGAPDAMRFKLDDPELSASKSLGFVLMVPLSLAIWWYSEGVGMLLAGKLISMRNAAGVNNVVCGLVWPLMLMPFMFWSWSEATLFGHGAAWGLFGILALLKIFWMLTLAREFYRVNWGGTIIGTLLGMIVGAVVFVAGFTVLVMIYGLLREQLPQYL